MEKNKEFEKVMLWMFVEVSSFIPMTNGMKSLTN